MSARCSACSARRSARASRSSRLAPASDVADAREPPPLDWKLLFNRPSILHALACATEKRDIFFDAGEADSLTELSAESADQRSPREAFEAREEVFAWSALPLAKNEVRFDFAPLEIGTTSTDAFCISEAMRFGESEVRAQASSRDVEL